MAGGTAGSGVLVWARARALVEGAGARGARGASPASEGTAGAGGDTRGAGRSAAPATRPGRRSGFVIQHVITPPATADKVRNAPVATAPRHVPSPSFPPSVGRGHQVAVEIGRIRRRRRCGARGQMVAERFPLLFRGPPAAISVANSRCMKFPSRHRRDVQPSAARERFEGHLKGLHRGEPPGWVRRQRPHHDFRELARVGLALRRPARRTRYSAGDLVQDLEVGAGRERCGRPSSARRG